MAAHKLIMINAGSAHSLLVNQPGPAIPIQRSTTLIGPTLGWKSQLHSRASATAGVRLGRKKSVRNILVPLTP